MESNEVGRDDHLHPITVVEKKAELGYGIEAPDLFEKMAVHTVAQLLAIDRRRFRSARRKAVRRRTTIFVGLNSPEPGPRRRRVSWPRRPWRGTAAPGWLEEGDASIISPGSSLMSVRPPFGCEDLT